MISRMMATAPGSHSIIQAEQHVPDQMVEYAVYDVIVTYHAFETKQAGQAAAQPHQIPIDSAGAHLPLEQA